MSDSNNTPGGFGGAGGWGAPGQRITKIETGASESSLVAKQAYIMGVTIFTCQLALLAIIAILTAIMGWLVVLVAIEIALAALCVAWAVKSQEAGLSLAVFMMVGTAGAIMWPYMVDFLLLRPFHTAGLIVVGVLVYFSISIWLPGAFLAWRMAAEISDPSYASPRVSVKRVTPAWPWTSESEFDEFQGDVVSEGERAEMTEMLRAALARENPRSHALLVVHDHYEGRQRAEAFGIDENLPEVSSTEDETPVTVLIENGKNGLTAHLEHMTPVPVQDLRRYIAEHRLGLSFRKSKAVLGWGELSWRSAVRTLTALGILSVNDDGKEPTLAVNIKTALDIVDSHLKLPEVDRKTQPVQVDTSGQLDIKDE